MTYPNIGLTFFRDAHDRWGQRANTTWQQLVDRLGRHDEGTKDGPALTCATFNYVDPYTEHGRGRGNSTLATRSLIALDIETNKDTGVVPPPPDAFPDLLRAKGLAAAIWTTHSHTPDEPRWRAVFPLSRPIDLTDPDNFALDPYLAPTVAAQLELVDVVDRSKFGAASLMFLPRHPPGTSIHYTAHTAGQPIETSELLAVAQMVSERVAADEAKVLAMRRAAEFPPEIVALLTAYNESHPLSEAFTRYGYQRQRGRWKSPYQHGTGATTILPDGLTWVSFSESDADAGVGNRPIKRTSQCACWGDAFSLFVHFEQRGSFRNALAALRATEAA